MSGKKIIFVLIFIFGILSISAVNAFEGSENSTDIGDNVTVVDSTPNVEVSDLNESAQSDLTKNDSDEIKSISLTPSKLSTTYGSGKYFKVKVIDSKAKKPASNVKLILKVYSGNKYKKITIKSDSNGIAKYHASMLGIGSHKVIVNVKDSKRFLSKEKSSLIKLQKLNWQFRLQNSQTITMKIKNTKSLLKIKNLKSQ